MKSLSYSFCFIFHAKFFELPSAKLSMFGLAPFKLFLAVSFLAAPIFCAAATDDKSADDISPDSKRVEEVERYTVTAERPYYNETLNSIFPQYSYDKSNLVGSPHINDILLQSPSVNLNGQGGQIQNINIRGFSRWRIQSLLNGVPIVSDRRAGASVGFVPPSFIQGVAVIPGAASTYLGSGAIGGAVDLLLPSNTESNLQLGWSSNQQAQDYSYADYAGNTDWNLSYRKGNNGSDAQGNTLFDKFEQTALFIRHRPESGVLKEAWTLYSDNRDIGKSSSDFPEDRVTTYPENTHWLGKMTFAFSDLFSEDIASSDTSSTDLVSHLWWHQSTLDTHILRPEDRINESESEALDFGFDVGSNARINNWQVNWQVQLMGREGVIIDEREFSLVSSASGSLVDDSLVDESPTNQPLLDEASNLTDSSFISELAYELRTLDASETTVAGITDASRTFGATSLAFGGRLDWQQQSNNADDVTNTNVSGFIGASHTLSTQWSASVYLSSAFRNPSLTERYFSGETPRGTVLGDADLDTEQATNIQASLLYNSTFLTGSVEVFRQKINHYIERTTVSEDVQVYSNLDSATIQGISYQLDWQQSQAVIRPQNNGTDPGYWFAQLNGAWIDGEDAAGNAIADIPPNSQRLTLGYELEGVRLFSTLVYRASKRDIGDGEKALDNVTTLDIGAAWELSQRTSVQASWRNLTNQQYYVSADDKAAFAQGESVQLALTFLL
ncbi:TonB-dependent receptor [Alteromonas sp. CI.11.F.A3]|uniref:TonB-dependent receptor plug domain-containing protein n=1 Tax=Alteromonas sp. CI.11.F.A3 TaxID=3079555 RepID=UPI0029438978|nr:TonB-dependent receptor [Alteromonas sp. CI.11.F.A3]WOI38626.1 TonB-dependent receptor [Alteromonas sp. CI.11.F.A3]